MGFRLAYTNMATGGTYPGAYHRIRGLALLDTQERHAEVVVDTYVDQQAYLDGKRPIETRNFAPVNDVFDAVVAPAFSGSPEGNLDTYLYNWVKALDLFQGAEDA